MQRIVAICAVAVCGTANGADEILNYAPEFSAFLANGSIIESCIDSPRGHLDGFSNHDCSIYLNEKRKAALEAKELMPQDCDDQALYEGYGELKLNMRVSLTDSSYKVVKFQGEVVQGDDSQFVVFDSQSGSNAVILYGANMRFFNDVIIGSRVVGYGGVEGSTTAKLASGREAQIPVIDAYCVQ